MTSWLIEEIKKPCNHESLGAESHYRRHRDVGFFNMTICPDL
ncbi:hypothetical protein SynROS8604_01028 [Synechococcus sp. ROS8604]|nr:hypothetical protein SynROS8604_01028 [Synechococcus sp. ROS8604]